MPNLNNKEKEMLYVYIGRCKHFLEFGAGETTIYAASIPGIQRIDSVDCCTEYIDELIKNNRILEQSILAGKLIFHLIDIGNTEGWGYPVNDDKTHLYPNYALSIFAQKSEHDLVFIDGRFRVACALSTILNSKPDCLICIHDFWNRKEYAVLLRFLETMNKIDTLGIFRKREAINIKKARSLLKKYQYLPRDRTLLFRIRNVIKRQLCSRFHLNAFI